jgi:thiamine pyrophosphate-dependent acetolactate synthase large subunit-like protein
MPEAAEFVPNRLAECGADRGYGYPGDGINAFLGAFEKVVAPQFSQVRHEEMAAFLRRAGQVHRHDRRLVNGGTLSMIGTSFPSAERQHLPGAGR